MLFPLPHRSVPRILSLEVAETRPINLLVEVHLRHDHGAPFLGLGENAALTIVNVGDHPIVRNVGICAADEEDMIFAGARGGEERVAACDGEGDYRSEETTSE